MTNTVATRTIPRRQVAMEAFDREIAKLPRRVRDYLLFDCPKCLDPATVRAALDEGYGLDWLKTKMRRDAMEVYGKEYFG